MIERDYSIPTIFRCASILSLAQASRLLLKSFFLDIQITYEYPYIKLMNYK